MAQEQTYFFLAAGFAATTGAFLAATALLVFWVAFLLVALGDLSPMVIVLSYLVV